MASSVAPAVSWQMRGKVQQSGAVWEAAASGGLEPSRSWSEGFVPGGLLPPSLFEHPAAELSVDDSVRSARIADNLIT
jgi:hypothetical protein